MNSYKNILSNSLKAFILKPLVIIPSILLFVSSFFLSLLAQKVKTRFDTNTELIIFTIISTIIIFLVLSIFFSLLITISKQTFKGRFEISNAIKNSFKKILKIFVIILITLLIYNIVQQVAYYLATFIGRSLSLDLNPAKFLFFILYFLGLSGILIFFSLSTFTLIIRESSILESIRSSIKIVKQNYLFVLSVFVILFVISEISSLVNSTFNELLSALIITPLISLIFTNLILNNDIRTK